MKYLNQADTPLLEDKLHFYSLAEEKFQTILSLNSSHSETLYQFALMRLERDDLLREEEQKEGEERRMTRAREEIRNAEQMLTQIIHNDTSRRGEITGEAHRTLASLYLQHFSLFLPSHHNSSLSLIRKSLTHLERAREILASHSTELALYFFEYCEAFNTFWETYFATHSGPTCDSNEQLTIIQDCFLFFKQTIDSCLSFPSCSSGLMDRDIYLLYGTFLNNYCEFVTAVTVTSPFYDHLRSDVFHTFLHGVVVDTIRSVSRTLCFLGNLSLDDSSAGLVEKERERVPDEVVENIECLSLSADLLRSLLEIWDWNKVEPRSLCSPASDLESFYDDSRSLIYLRIYIRVMLRIHQSHCSGEVVFSNLLSLAEDLMFFSSVIERHSQELEISKLCALFGGNLLSLLQQDCSLGEGLFHLPCFDSSSLDSFSDLTDQLYQYSKSFFLVAIPVYESQSRKVQVIEEDKGRDRKESEESVIEGSDYCTLLYNLLCVCWKLHQSDECEEYLRKYIQSLSAEKSCQESEVVDEVMTEIQRDKDINGFFESEICDRVRHQLLHPLP